MELRSLGWEKSDEKVRHGKQNPWWQCPVAHAKLRLSVRKTCVVQAMPGFVSSFELGLKSLEPQSTFNKRPNARACSAKGVVVSEMLRYRSFYTLYEPGQAEATL